MRLLDLYNYYQIILTKFFWNECSFIVYLSFFTYKENIYTKLIIARIY